MALTYSDDKLVKGAEILELYQEAGWSQLERRKSEDLEAAVRGSERFFTAREGMRLVGYVMAQTDLVLYAHITELLVRPGHKDKGVAEDLISRLMESLPGVEIVTAFGEPDSQDLYGQFGFKPFTGGLMRREG